jgi:glucose/arabinose dehydrogenase
MFVKIAIRIVLALGLNALVANAQLQPSTAKALPGAASSKTEPATIEGRTVRASDNSPLKKAMVTAMSTQTVDAIAMHPKAVTTDADGKFLLKDLESGRYTLSATRNGFARQSFGENAASGQGTALTVASGQKISEIMPMSANQSECPSQST